MLFVGGDKGEINRNGTVSFAWAVFPFQSNVVYLISSTAK
jgi:hypothetical protein